jgi:hypothetical protein
LITNSVMTLSPRSCAAARKGLEILQRAVVRIDAVVVGDVVAVVLQRRGIERQNPDRRCPKFLEVIELLDQPAEVADAIAIAVVKGLNVQLVDDRIFVPEWVDGRRFGGGDGHGLTGGAHSTHAQYLPSVKHHRTQPYPLLRL